MVELYVDDVSLENIKHEKGGQLLIFTNEVNGEALLVKVSNMELQNIYWQIQKHCSALGYI